MKAADSSTTGLTRQTARNLDTQRQRHAGHLPPRLTGGKCLAVCSQMFSVVVWVPLPLRRMILALAEQLAPG
jgi:hypothetical protein